MFKFKSTESTTACQVWSYRKASFDANEIHKIQESGQQLPNTQFKKLKAAPGWRLVRLSKKKRLLVRIGVEKSPIVVIALWRKDLDRVCDHVSSNLYRFEGGAA